MISELESVVLTRDVTESGLKEGDIGAVVHCYRNEQTFEVEFVTADERTVAVLTLHAKDVRPVRNSEILHVRELASA